MDNIQKRNICTNYYRHKFWMRPNLILKYNTVSFLVILMKITTNIKIICIKTDIRTSILPYLTLLFRLSGIYHH
jgi:hypothetical protein